LTMALPLGRILEPTFFARPSDEVAPDLIGKILWAEGVGGGRLTEVEAYLPEGDPACHAARGRTPRNAPMFGPPGSVYVYRSYGIHVLLNLVCDIESVASAVLIRSFEPLGENANLRHNRGVDTDDARRLSCGPGRVGQALGLHLGLNGLPLGAESGLFVLDDGFRPEVEITTRVGISEGDQLLLRYYMRGTRCVSGLARVERGAFE
jgi:DNA-3-methyladenine glycosylase